MGGIIAAVNTESDGQHKKPTEGTGGGTGSTESKGTAATSTGTGGTGGGNGAGGNGTGGSKGTISKEDSTLAILTDAEKAEYETADDKRKKAILKNARRRVKYAEDKAAGGQTVRPRKVRKKETEQAKSPVDKTSLNMLLMSVSAVVAARPGQDHWQITEAEANSITEPLANMIAESSAFANIGAYSNQIALVMACGSVFIPRVIVSATKAKEKKRNAVTGQTTNTNAGEIGSGAAPKKAASNTESNRKNDSHAAGNGANNGSSEPWYGDAISY